MTLLTRNLFQNVTHWAANTVDGSFDPGFVAPAALKGRWEDRIVKFIDEQGAENESRSVVYLSISVDIGDYLFLGTSTVTDPTTVSGAYEVRDYREVSSVKNTQKERRAIL